jgi:hypothetical protein
MHDLDRTLDASELEGEIFADELGDEYGYELGDEEYGADELGSDYEYDGEYDGYELEGEYDGEIGDSRPFSAAEEMELAAELLTVSDEAELEQFLGKVFKKAWGGVKKFAKSSVGRKLGGILKGVARTALPIVGRAAGTFFGGPVGGMIGGKLASAAGKAFGLELEGMAPEEAEMEVARRFVRLAGSAAQNAARAPKSAPSAAVAKAAVTAAARLHAPGLVRGGALTLPVAGRRTGRWIRRGRRIVLYGV